MAQYADRIVIEVDGQEISDVVSVDFKENTNAEVVPTMNSKNRAKGHRKGVCAYDASIEVAVPEAGDEYDWHSLAPFGDGPEFKVVGITGSTRKALTGCFIKSIGEKGSVNSNVTRSLEIGALDYKKE